MNTSPLQDADIARLQALLDRVPEPLEALDAVALDGFLCGIVLQPRSVPPAKWLPHVTDFEGRDLPGAYPKTELHALVLRRHAEIERAVAARDWFDPWIFELEEDAPPSEAVLPWVAGFAAAMDLFPALMNLEDPELVEPLALLYRHFDPADLEDADALLAVIETLEPAEDLAEAVQDLVRSLMLIADVSRPRAATPRPRPPAARKTGKRRPG
ncbi:YecA family protein [Rubrivivax gelatinosus]|nr:YecA family protein [Rubrivivax gelatinosus]